MKKSLLRLIALILSLASLVSMLTVFAWADDSTTEEEYVNPYPDFDYNEELLYTRDFDEGWGPENGATNSMGQHKAEIDYEESLDYKYNYFMRLTYGNSTSAGSLQFNFNSRSIKTGTTIISLSIKADDACEAGRILYYKGDSGAERDLLLIRNSNLYAFNSASANFLCSLADNDWYDVDIVLDWSDHDNFHATAYLNGEYVTEITAPNSSPDAGIKTLYLGLQAPSSADDAAKKEGMSYCVDNLDIYQETNQNVEFLPFELDPQWGYGVFINRNAEKTVPIYESAQDKTPDQILAESLGMKLGVGSALMKDKKISLDDYIVPTVVDGEVIVSLQLILDFMGYTYYLHPDGMSYDISFGAGKTAYVTLGRDIATVNGELVALDMMPGVVKNANGDDVVVISINDIVDIFPDWAVTYDDMGLIIVYENIAKDGESSGNLINRNDNLDGMLDMMKKFVFDTVESDDGIDASYTATGEKILESVKANTNLQHPYIYTNQETFDKLSGIYGATDGDAALKSYIEKEVAKAEAYYEDVVESEDGNTVTFKDGKKPINVYQDGEWPDETDPTTANVVPDSDDGYNPTTSALYELEEYSAHLVELAFAYQITKDTKYVKLAYAVSLALGEWVHWGPGYFVNTANAANDFAVSYDWLYNAYTDIYGEEAVETLAQILYTKALYPGYNSSIGEFCQFPRTAGYGDKYTTRTDSWNAICSAGMIVASMAIMGTEAYNDNVTYLLGNNITNLANYGLDQYAPDGSYIESVTYWALGTNAFMQTIMALQSATGDDFGFKDTWGIESTFYFACYIENSNGEAWNYHEDAVGTLLPLNEKLTVDTQMFNYAAQLLGNADLVAIRNAQIAKGKETTIYDILFYPEEPIGEAPELELTYVMEGLDAYVARSSWEDGALYVGIMGGINSYSPYGEGDGEEFFGQIDSGNFIYQNNGVKWIIDHGSDNHYAYSYFGTERYKYFRNSAEGHNVVIITSAATDVPYGQDINAGGNIEKTYTDENGKGSYVVLNNSKVYGAYSNTARRGMLIMNNEETGNPVVVVQDQISLINAGNLTWVVNTGENIEVDADNARVAYFNHMNEDGTRLYLRATIVSPNPDFHFEILEDNTKLLRGTRDKDADQFDISDNKRLVIEAESAVSFNVAVVFEVLPYSTAVMDVGYTYTDITFWDNMFIENNGGNEVARRGNPVREDIIDKTIAAQDLYDEAIAYTSYFHNYYEALCTIAYTLKTFPLESFMVDPIGNKAYTDRIQDYEDMLEDYNDYIEYTNQSVEKLASFVDRLSGI